MLEKISLQFRRAAIGLLLVLALSGCGLLYPLPPTESLDTATPFLTTETQIMPSQTNSIDYSVETIASPGLPPTNTPAPTTLLPTPTETPSTPAIILFIGDGMGVNHRLAATWTASGEGGLLVMDNMPVHGLASTTSTDQIVTDSAAAATALSSGVQTNYTALGVDPDNHAVTTILEHAQAAGWSVGLVSTVNLTDATPAAFASHVQHRNEIVQIARQMMALHINVLLGGGEDHFYGSRAEGCYPGKGYQSNQVDLVEDALEFGYAYVCTPEQFDSLDLTGVDHLLGLFGGVEMQHPFQPALSEMTRAAIEVLSQDPDGFFLMVEAGQIDWAAHENDAEHTISFTLGLDAAVAQAKVFALERPNTMIIVTADHETGGMRLNLDGLGSYRLDGPFEMPNGNRFWVDWSSGHHTDELVPVTAQGPYTELLSGEYHLTRIFDTMFLMLYAESQ
jgi:alkaline phosphatase